jgi:predicted dehydrogenase
VLTLEDGTIVHTEYTVAVDCLPGWVVQGNRGTIVVRDKELTHYRVEPARPEDPTKYSTMTEEGESVKEETLDGSPYGDEHEVYREIVLALRGERPFAVSPEHAYELSCVFDAVRISAAENRTVDLDEVRKL